MTDMTVCVQCIVTGRVQGVFFRAETQRKAQELNICGWAHNLSDGSVEVMACGEEAQIEEFQNWLWIGPPHAKVTDVRVTEIEEQLFKGFSVG